MKKLLIGTSLLCSAIILSGCNSTPNIEEDTQNTGSIETTEIGTGLTESGSLNDLTGEKNVEIKDLIEDRKTELQAETGTKKELTEKDIELLEAITNKLGEKK